MEDLPATQLATTFSDCVRLADRGSSPQGVLHFQSGRELLFGEAIPRNVAPAWQEKSTGGRRCRRDI